MAEDDAGGNGELGRSSIKLPDGLEVAFRNIEDARIFAMDIGGSLTKIAYYSSLPTKKIVYDGGGASVHYEVSEGARLHFIKFETKHISSCLEYIGKSLKSRMVGQDIKVTGGGAYKYADLIKEKVGLPIDKRDEMLCVVQGCNFVLKNISDEAFVYSRKKEPAEYKFQTINPKEMYPYLLVTIGSGVSILKVESDDKFERIGGTATGGGTFWGLGKLLTKAKDFDDLLELAAAGDHRNVDMLVRDIYGEKDNYQTLGLPPDLIASSLGKVIASSKESSDRTDFSDADIARSLLYMISNDIGQIASLYAMLHHVKTIYFGGFFLRHHPVSMHTVGFSVNYWSKGQVQVRFLRHEGYLGAIGAFLCQGVEGFKTEEYSWLENLYGSSGFTGPKKDEGEGMASNLDLKQLEIDRFEKKLRFCPLLLDPQKYVADTVDLTEDGDAREYWLHCLEESLPKFTERAIKSQADAADVLERAEAFKSEFLSRLHRLKDNPFAYGNLTVRSLLDLREHCLAEFDFHDPYLKQKRMENEQALELFPARLQHLSQLSWEERMVQLAIGFLAGNVFDWGAKEVALLMEEGNLNFDSAIAAIGPRPWLMDSLDEWLKRLRGPPHRCAAIFIDNSGVDVILGVMPFVEELLRRGTKVLLCANNRPVLNDVTFAELVLILQRASSVSEVLSNALANGKLECLDSGQGSPCLDLTKLNKKVTDAMKKNGCDLLVLEGMGRAVHTNLFAEFKCECLKVAVLKNRWLANKLGGDMYAVIFRYESPGEEDPSVHRPSETLTRTLNPTQEK